MSLADKMEIERTRVNSAEKSQSGFSISSIMGFQNKNVGQSCKDTRKESLNEKLGKFEFRKYF